MIFARHPQSRLLSLPLSLKKRRNEAAFTLVELMVAVTGGLFVSMAVFALARNGSRFYQQESRIAEATLGNVVAFERLSHDIARAGFLSTPNIAKDPMYCGTPNSLATLPSELQNLASLRIEADSTAANNVDLKTAGRTPQTITLSGAYDSVDRYETWHVDANGAGYAVRLQTGIGALVRSGYSTKSVGEQQDLLNQLFPTRRALRLLNADTGSFQVSTITGTGITNGEAYIYLSPTPVLNIAGQQRCGLRGTTLVNVVNIVRYSLRAVKGDTTNYANYQTLFETGKQPYEDDRLELIREELDTSGKVLPGKQEVVAEYAVDLQFALTSLMNFNTPTPSLVSAGFQNPDVVQSLAGPVNIATSKPQWIRSVRARLSVRSREVDREANVATSDSLAPGLYRIRLEDSATKEVGFARVRTLQSDIVIPSHLELRWKD